MWSTCHKNSLPDDACRYSRKTVFFLYRFIVGKYQYIVWGNFVGRSVIAVDRGGLEGSLGDSFSQTKITQYLVNQKFHFIQFRTDFSCKFPAGSCWFCMRISSKWFVSPESKEYNVLHLNRRLSLRFWCNRLFKMLLRHIENFIFSSMAIRAFVFIRLVVINHGIPTCNDPIEIST